MKALQSTLVEEGRHPKNNMLSWIIEPIRALHQGRKWNSLLTNLAGAIIIPFLALTAWSQQNSTDLTQQSLEDLMNINVTSASRREQKVSEVAAAMFVITEQDIRRSGATNIPDLLRMVPGLDVAQINASTWAISARGFNHQKADKLLVLIDGRSVLTMIYGGVFWDTQDVPLEDIDRIEVIRGPGATMWGSNAVNGVINIITKTAGSTTGALVSASAGFQDRVFGTTQYGSKIGRNAAYRVYTKYLDEEHLPDLTLQNGMDGWHQFRSGFRLDQKLSQADSLMAEGEIHAGKEGAVIQHIYSIDPPVSANANRVARVSGGHILARWDHVYSTRSDTTFQVYFDKYNRAGPEVGEAAENFDVEYQQHLALGARHDLIWGAGYRRTSDDTAATIDLGFDPADRVTYLFNSFFQDEVMLRPDRLRLTFGTKVEHNTFGGFHVQPSARIAWTPSGKQTLWASASSVSGTPDRRNTDCDINLTVFMGPDGIPIVPTLLGNPHEKSEGLVAIEGGYRGQPSKRFSIDIATFWNEYRDLPSMEYGTPVPATVLAPKYDVLPIRWANKIHGMSDGGELSANWRVSEFWTLSPSYELLQLHLHTDPTSLDTTTVSNTEGSNPRHQAQMRSHVSLSRSLTWDANAYFVGPLPAQPTPSYTRLDSQITWGVGEWLQLSLVGQNLLKDHHVESNDGFTTVNSSEMKRTAHAKITWRF
jgi:iron complex outermembrane receptor protein